MTLATDGHVGIGTPTPSARLTISGSGRNVGIGTAAPNAQLQIAGAGTNGFTLGVEGHGRTEN